MGLETSESKFLANIQDTHWESVSYPSRSVSLIKNRRTGASSRTGAGKGSVGCLGGIVLRRRTGGFRPVFASTKSLISDLVTGMREPVDRMVSHAGTGIARTMRPMHDATVATETGTGEQYIAHTFFNNKNTVPASARLTTKTNHSIMRAKTTLLLTFGTRRARYRPSLRLESRISIRADRFEACLARIARNATNKKITSA